ncbi:hypothetical protein Droror1_Dr00027748 [Drosera rotundifolia]
MRKARLSAIKYLFQYPNSPHIPIRKTLPTSESASLWSFIRTQKSNYSTSSSIANDPIEKWRVSRQNLTREVVESTLAKCPNDLVALNYFLWCARQPNYFHDYGTIDGMVDVVGRLRDRFISTNGIVWELRGVGCVIKAQTFLLLLRVCWRGGMYRMVLDVVDEMSRVGYELNEFAHFVVLDVLFKMGNVGAALVVLEEMPCRGFFDLALCNLCRLKDVLNVKMVLRVVLGRNVYPEDKTLVMVFDRLCKEGLLVEAFQVLGLRVLLGFQVSSTVWSILINGFCRAGRYVEASCLLEKMIAIGFCPNVRTFTFLIKGFLESSMIDQAFRMLHLMNYSGCKVDVVFFNVLVHCFLKMGLLDEALSVLFEMRKKNLEPDRFTVSSVISSLHTSRKFALLAKLFVRSDVPLDLVVCNSVLSYFCKVGFPHHALKLYGRMLDEGFMSDKYTYAGLLSACCRTNRISEAVTFYRKVRSSLHTDTHVHAVILDGLIKAEKYEAAFCLFKEALAAEYPLDVVSYTIVIRGLVRSSRVDDAHALYCHMKELSISANRHTCNTLILGLCWQKDLNSVGQILTEMLDAQIQLDFRICMKIGDLMFKCGSCLVVFPLLIEMWDLGLVSDAALLILLVEGFDKGIQVDKIYHLSLEGYIQNGSFVVYSSSDDQSDMMALAG